MAQARKVQPKNLVEFAKRLRARLARRAYLNQPNVRQQRATMTPPNRQIHLTIEEAEWLVSELERLAINAPIGEAVAQ